MDQSTIPQLGQDRTRTLQSANDLQWGLQRVPMTHILATDVVARLPRLPAGVYVAVDVGGTTTKTSIQPVTAVNDDSNTIEWHQEIYLPSERSSMISVKAYATSSEVDPTPENDELLHECTTTVGELLDQNGELQRYLVDDLSSRSVCDSVGRGVSVTPVSLKSTPTALETRIGLSQMLSSFFNRPKFSPQDAKVGPRIFALIVAIDKYKSEKNADLSGCKSDGQRFVVFLTSMLGVPSSRIVFLHDKNATRDAIFYQFNKHLIENTDIVRGDAIVFFYAGHGSRVNAPLGWVSEGNKIEAICPHDEKTIGPDGTMIYAIPDRTIGGLIRMLASKKGDNIITIFDCCHSGGISRSDESLHVRSTPPPSDPPPPELDLEIWDSTPQTSTRGAKSAIPAGSYKAMESHILLAACRPNEVALGDTSGGLFTSALLKALERCTFHDTTYARLFERLCVRNDLQHPQCLGGNKDRLLFSVATVRHGETTFKISQRGDGLYASAGTIHGIVVGTEFTLKSGKQTIALKVVKVGAFECLLERFHHSNFQTATLESAVVSNWNHPTLRVHSSVHESNTHFTVVPADEPADIAVRQDGSEWEFERFDVLIPKYSSRCITVTAETRPMLEAPNLIANFNSYLYRSDRAGGTFAGEIRVRLNRVAKKGSTVYPTGEDLLDVPSLWLADMEVKQATITDLDAEYCLTIENFSEVDLFPYLFYFDPSNYSVEGWYIPPSPTMLPPLERRKVNGSPSLFAYGYGGFGTDPVEFYLPPGRTTDSGFLKVFLTNTYVDMNAVAQSSIEEMRWFSHPKVLTPKGIWECRTFVLTCKAS